MAHINKSKQVYDPLLQILISDKLNKDNVGVCFKIDYKVSNTCDSLVTNKRDHRKENGNFHKTKLQGFMWIL